MANWLERLDTIIQWGIDKYNNIDYDMLQNIIILGLVVLVIILIILNYRKSHFLFLTQMKIGTQNTYFLWELNKDDLFKKMIEEKLALENKIISEQNKNKRLSKELSKLSLVTILLILPYALKNFFKRNKEKLAELETIKDKIQKN